MNLNFTGTMLLYIWLVIQSCGQSDGGIQILQRDNEVKIVNKESSKRIKAAVIDSTIIKIVPDSISFNIRKQLNSGQVMKEVMLNKELPHSLPFAIVNENQIVFEYYYLSFRENFNTRKINKYIADTLYMSFDRSFEIDSEGTSMVFFQSKVYVSLKNAQSLKQVVFID